jgi:hypothetical protein
VPADADANQQLADQLAIRDVLMRYCRSMDRMDRALGLSVWHPDGTANYADMYEGTGAGFIDWVFLAHQGMLRHSHQITNVLVEVNGDHAVSEAYVTVVLWSMPVESPTEIISRGRYLDRWSKRDGRWAIDHREYVTDLMTATPLSPEALEGVAAASRRDRDDVSYALFGSS